MNAERLVASAVSGFLTQFESLWNAHLTGGTTIPVIETSRIRTCSRRPDESGYVARDGVRVYWERYGDGPATILVLPTWSVLDAGHGRFQVVDLARHYRVVTFDPRGNGRSDRPTERAAYATGEFVADAVAVLDATATKAAVVVACSLATHWLLRLAADHPRRVLGAIASGTGLPLAAPHDYGVTAAFDEPYRSTNGWAKFNAQYWHHNYEDFLRFFFSRVWTEPHSDRLIDTCVTNGLQTTPETLIQTVGANPLSQAEAMELVRRTTCPWLVIHGDHDELQPHTRAEALATEARATLVTFVGAGHCSGNRDPVRFNLLVREFTEKIRPHEPAIRSWTRAQSRPRHVVIVPGTIDAVDRDVRLARAIRGHDPDTRIDWVSAPELRDRLTLAGESVHPLSGGIPAADRVSADPFDAWRASDEQHLVTFAVLNDLVDKGPVDLVVADASLAIDHHLHENPELKRFAYAWIADRISWHPEADADVRRTTLMHDANAEMLEQLARYPRIRDASIFMGTVDALPAATFGPGLPVVREWAAERFSLAGSGEAAETRAVEQLMALLFAPTVTTRPGVLSA